MKYNRRSFFGLLGASATAILYPTSLAAKPASQVNQFPTMFPVYYLGPSFRVLLGPDYPSFYYYDRVVSEKQTFADGTTLVAIDYLKDGKRKVDIYRSYKPLAKDVCVNLAVELGKSHWRWDSARIHVIRYTEDSFFDGIQPIFYS